MYTTFATAVSMRDGVTLATDVYTPAGAGPWPVILIRTPYGRRSARLGRKVGIYTSHGFAVVLQDVRGTGGSTTASPFYPWWAEGEDGHDTLEWLQAQSFCDGNVGTHGGSYLATGQWLAAPGAPACLKCMVTYVGPHSFAAGYYNGGVHHLAITLSYALLMSGGVDFSAGWQAGWRAMHAKYAHLPLCDADLVDGRHAPFFQDMIRRPLDDPYWRRFDALADPEAITVPVLQLCGWFDHYPMPSFRAWETLRRAGGTREAREGSRILAGAWAHDRAGTRCAEMDFGPNVAMDLYWYELRFFTRWLKGVDDGLDAEPPVRVFTMGTNCWQDFADWPAPDAALRRLYLHEGGMLHWEAPGTEPADTFRYDPLDPVPTVGGNHSCDYACLPAGPMNQSAVETRDDVLLYTSPVLNRPVEIAGPVRLRLFAATDGPDTDFMAKLVDVQPDGTPINLSEGAVRASFAYPPGVEPDTPYAYEIALVDLSHVFLPGHRIRLEVSSSNFPKYTRNLNTGADSHTTAATRVAVQTIYHDAARASAVEVWVR